MTRTVYQPNKEPGGSGSVRDMILKANKNRKGGRKGGRSTNGGRFPSPPGGGGGGRGLSPRGRNQRYGAMGSFPGIAYGDALSLVNAELKPQLNELQSEKQKLRRETQAERQRARRDYRSTVGDLNHIFGETGDYIGFQNQAIQDQYSQLTDRSQQAQAALLDHLQTQGQSNMGAAQSELARLGIGAPGMLDQMAADQANMVNVANQTGANNMANIAMAQTAAGDVGNLLAGMNAGSRASALGQAATAKSDALFEAEANKRQSVEQVTRAMRDLRMSRGDLTRQMLEQLLQSRWGMHMDQANLNLQREQLDMQKAAQAAQNRYYNSLSSNRGGSGGSGYSNYSSNYSGGGGSYTNYGGGSSADAAPTGSPSATDDKSLGAYNQMIMQLLGNKPKGKKRKKK